MNKVEEFNQYRNAMNTKIFAAKNKVLDRFFNLDTNAYMAGSLDVRTKELIGLTSSLVLRCDDCVRYHLEKCVKEGLTREQIVEAMSISTLIGGSIVIPHLRRAFEYLEALDEYNHDQA